MVWGVSSTWGRLGRALVCVTSLALGMGACAPFATSLPLAPAQANSAEAVYKIGALDTLNIVVWHNPDLSANVSVRPDGRVSLPLVDDLPAAGRQPAELARDIEKALAKFIRDPVVTVTVGGFRGAPAEQVRIVGEASRPQAIAFRQSMTVLDVMIQVGGLTDYADGNSAVLVRGKEPAIQYRLRLKDLLKRGDISANVDMLPGDVIIVPQSIF